MKKFSSLKEFYPYYLSEHLNPICRGLHFVGTTISLILAAYFIYTANYSGLWLCLVIGYGFAWVGHFFFEKNRPATFKYPLYSFVSDFIMWGQILSGRIKIRSKVTT